MKKLIFLLVTSLVLGCSEARAQFFFASGGDQDGSHGSGGTEQAMYAISVNARWNLTSVPVIISDNTRATLFPSATSNAFAYDPNTGYTVSDSLKHGIGYWLKFSSAQTIPLNGLPIEMDSVDVQPGWNIIGSITHPIATSSITTLGTMVQSEFFTYESGYRTVSSIVPGKGHWVKVSTAGKLVLSSTGSVAKPSGKEELSGFHKLTIQEKTGNAQILYFGKKPSENFNVDFYGLPPLPPGGNFDARFASQRMVEVYPERLEKPHECRIDIFFASYPITVSWELNPEQKVKLTLTDANGGKSLGNVALNQEGSLKIENPEVCSLTLIVQSGKQIPTEFALRQSYPNPFNPAAIIKFDLPTDAVVTLKVYDILSREVAVLADNQRYEAGTHQAVFNASDFASGIYFYRISAQSATGTFVDVKKMLMIR